MLARQASNVRVPPMTDIILHHYDTSPYAEKVRTGLGLKGLAWASVELSRHHAETESDGADGRLSQDAGSADWRGHLLRQPVDHARTRAPVPHSELLSRRAGRSRRACLVGREDNLPPGCQHRVREETRRVA